jgi:hypothetical protein
VNPLSTVALELQVKVRLLGAGIDEQGAKLNEMRSAVLRAEIESGFALLHARIADLAFPEWPRKGA